jgi:hypothetical protein
VSWQFVQWNNYQHNWDLFLFFNTWYWLRQSDFRSVISRKEVEPFVFACIGTPSSRDLVSTEEDSTWPLLSLIKWTRQLPYTFYLADWAIYSYILLKITWQLRANVTTFNSRTLHSRIATYDTVCHLTNTVVDFWFPNEHG